jgi:hypothetical protein
MYVPRRAANWAAKLMFQIKKIFDCLYVLNFWDENEEIQEIIVIFYFKGL